jgi:hypothetical protein
VPIDPEELSTLLSNAVQFGEQMIAEHGTFYPYGFTLDQSGEVAMTGAWNGEEHPEPRAIYQLLQQAFTRDIASGKVKAIALAADVTIPKEYSPAYPDGIRVLVEARDFSRFIYVPYSRPATGQASFAEMFSVEVPHAFFGRS